MRKILGILFAFALAAQAQPLREAAKERGIRIGAAAASGYLNERDYTDALAGEFNQLQPENDLKWATVHPGRTAYNFKPADALVDFAQAHDMAVRGHTLLWHQSNPSWLEKGSWTSAELSEILSDHIRTVVSHYAGKLYGWDVVNEAFNDDGTLRESIWYNKPGIDLSGTGYIEQAFRWARAADAKALLFYNDYGAEGLNAKSDAVYRMVRDFRARGVPIDGVGLQAHFTKSGVSLSALESNIARLTALGLQVQITELDVRLPVNGAGRASDADLAVQAKLYGDLTRVCLKFALCTAVQTWGLTDKHSWIPGFFPGFGAGLPLDASYNRKPAHAAMRESLLKSPPSTPATVANAASYDTSAVAAGEIVTIFGANYGPATLADAQPDARVYFDGLPGPILYALVNQASVVVPAGVAGRRTTELTYEYRGLRSGPVTLQVAPSAPGIFTLDGSGAGQAAALNPDDSINSPANPAPRGSVVALFATGAGAGIELPVSANLGEILYAGAPPGQVEGLFQVNVRLAPGLSQGPANVILSVGPGRSQAGVTVSVK